MLERLEVPAAKSRFSTRATRQAAGRGVERDPAAGDAAADDEDVERLALQSFDRGAASVRAEPGDALERAHESMSSAPPWAALRLM